MDEPSMSAGDLLKTEGSHPKWFRDERLAHEIDGSNFDEQLLASRAIAPID